VKKALLTAITALLAVLVIGVGSPAAAGRPTVEHFQIDRVRSDPGLTAACGVEVSTHVLGVVVISTFPDGTGPAELVTLNLALTAMAGDNTYSFRNVGANLVRVEPDGTAILLVTGQAPFEWTGVLKIDLETGEAILEPHHSVEGDLAEACAALTA
jgi:hypothetical protein